MLDDPERVVVGVTHARAEVSEAATTEAAAVPAEPEVIKKGKIEEEKEAKEAKK